MDRPFGRGGSLVNPAPFHAACRHPFTEMGSWVIVHPMGCTRAAGGSWGHASPSIGISFVAPAPQRAWELLQLTTMKYTSIF